MANQIYLNGVQILTTTDGVGTILTSTELSTAGFTPNGLSQTAWADTHRTVARSPSLTTQSTPTILALKNKLLVLNQETTPTAAIGIQVDNSGGVGTNFGIEITNTANNNDFEIRNDPSYEGSVVFKDFGSGSSTTQTKIKQGTVTLNDTANTNSHTLTPTSSLMIGASTQIELLNTTSPTKVNTLTPIYIQIDDNITSERNYQSCTGMIVDTNVSSGVLGFVSSLNGTNLGFTNKASVEASNLSRTTLSLTNSTKQNTITPTSVFLNDTTIVQQASLNTEKLRLLTSGLTNDITSDKMSIIKPATSSISEYGTDGVSLTGLFGAESRTGGFNLNTGLTTTNTTTKASGTLNESFVSLDSNISSISLGNKSTLNSTGLTCLNKVTPSTTSSLSSTALNVGITGSTVTVNSSGVSSTNILNLNSASQIDTNCAVRVRANPATTESATLTSGQLSMKNTNNTLQNNISSTSSAITNGTKTITMTVDGLTSTGPMSLGTATVNLTTTSTGITQTYPSNTTALATTQYVTTAISSIPTATPALGAVLGAGNTANNSIVLSDAVITNTISPVQIGISNVGGTIQSVLSNDSLGFTTAGDVFSTDATDLTMANTGGTISSALTKNSFTLTENTGATTRTVTLSNPTVGQPTLLLNSVDETTELNNTQINIYNLATNTQSYLTRTQLQLTSTTTDATMTKDELIMTEAVAFPAIASINTITRNGMSLSNSLKTAVYDDGIVLSNLASTIKNTATNTSQTIENTTAKSELTAGSLSNSVIATPDNKITVGTQAVTILNNNGVTVDNVTMNMTGLTTTKDYSIQTAAGKTLTIGSSSGTENVEIATQSARSVVLHLGDGNSNIAGSGVHINNGLNSVGNTQINNASGQTGTITIGNATSGTTTTNLRGTTSIEGTTNINTSGTTNTSIGNSTGTTTINKPLDTNYSPATISTANVGYFRTGTITGSITNTNAVKGSISNVPIGRYLVYFYCSYTPNATSTFFFWAIQNGASNVQQGYCSPSGSVNLSGFSGMAVLDFTSATNTINILLGSNSATGSTINGFSYILATKIG